ncbi:MAG: hydrogenase [Desulfitobacteriaceae bacterium]|nr:hydrogenase [Desulfitobacteriaceae bacterium]MDI6915633.1 hydrogenase [Desulfitobacteriaceae bacterium]
MFLGSSGVSPVVTLILAVCFLVLGARRLDTAIRLVVFQAILLALLTAILGLANGVGEMVFIAGLTLVIKAGLIPFILKKVVDRIGLSSETRSYVNRKMSFLIAGALVMVSYLATGQIAATQSAEGREILATAIAMLLIGLLVMMTRKLAVMQIVGFLIMENGLFLAGVGTTHGMPLVVELGIFLDMLIGVLVMGILTFRIQSSFGSINTEKLRNLRG